MWCGQKINKINVLKIKKKKDVHNRFIWNSPKLETKQMSIKKLMNKQFVAHSHNGRLFGSKKERTTVVYQNSDKSQKHQTLKK